MAMPAPLPPLPLPVRVNIESTLGCNLACGMCGSNLSGATRARRTMDETLLRRVEDEVLTEAVELSLTVAGEPLLTPSLGRFVGLAERRGLALHINTNGTLWRDTSLLRRLLAASALVKFSVDAADPALYARIRVGADLAQVCEAIRTVVRMRAALPRDRRPRLAACMVLMRCNVHELVPMVDLAHGLGLDRLEVAYMTVMTTALDRQSLRHWPDLADEQVRRARRHADRIGFRVSLPPLMDGTRLSPARRARARLALDDLAAVTPGRLRRQARFLRHARALGRWSRAAGGAVPCHFLQGAAYVTLGGDVAPCPMPGRPVAGNLWRTPFAAIWNGETLTAMRRAFLAGRPFACCAHCSQNPEGYDPADERTANPPDYAVPGLDRSGGADEDFGEAG